MTAEELSDASGFAVSRETAGRLERVIELLRRWQATTQLVAPSTLADIWRRHVADSLQLAALAPLDAVWCDIGSGGGFPGLVIAAAMRDRTLAPAGTGHIHLVEAKSRKAAFLREASRAAELPVTVHAARAEQALPSLLPVGVVTARALAPLEALCALVAPAVDKGAIALLPKGRDMDRELTEATRCWSIDADRIRSRIDPSSTILRVRRLTRLPVDAGARA